MSIPIKVVGMGPFPLPGEKKRHRKALEQVRRVLTALEQAKERGDPARQQRES